MSAQAEDAQRAVAGSGLDDGAAADVVDDQTRSLEHRVADDAVDVRSRQEALELTTQSGRRRPDLHAAEPELLQPDDGPGEIADHTGQTGAAECRAVETSEAG